MSNYSAMVVKLENVRKHPGADRLAIATAAEEPVVIGLEHTEGEIGIFFPAGTVIAHDFLMANNLYRKNPVTEEPMGGYFESNRRVRFQKFRGQMSRGIWLPFSSLEYLCLEKLPTVGTEFSELEGHELVQKYIETSKQPRQGLPGKPRSKKYENFYEIGETPKLVLNLHRLKKDDVLVVTEKLHGTSGRTAYLKVIKPTKQFNNWFEKLKDKVYNWCLNLLDTELVEDDEWAYVTGTRRMVLGENSPDDSNYRVAIHEQLKPHLSKGMIVYYEIVGHGIMQTHTPHGISDKELKHETHRLYGDEINYTYGVPSGFYDFYIYKIVEHNVDGVPYVYSWDQLVKWCKQHDLKHVPVLGTLLNKFEYVDERFATEVENNVFKLGKQELMDMIKSYCFGPSVLDPRHPKEGVVLQTKYGVFKHKSDLFCILEDIMPYSDPEDSIIVDE
jgi:hypothetical protein